MEREFVNWLTERLPPHPLLKLGLGDDAAILSQAASDGMVITTDLLADGVHFLTDETDPEWIGRKALAVNLSDLAAMAATPMAAVISILLPKLGAGRHDAGQLAQRIYEGLLPLAEEFNVVIAGGDTNAWDGKLAISVTALGQVTPPGPLTRSGSQPGDWLLVTGELGGSITGHHLAFTPRVHEALLLNANYQLHAGMDITDGLAIDLDRLAEQSGVGAVLDREDIPISASANQLGMASGTDAIDHALGDGEDFELLLAVPPEAAQKMLTDQPVECGLWRVGEVVAESGLWLRETDGSQQLLEPQGYLHG